MNFCFDSTKLFFMKIIDKLHEITYLVNTKHAFSFQLGLSIKINHKTPHGTIYYIIFS